MSQHEYRYHVYNFQDGPRAEAAKTAMAELEADGWQVHTAGPGYSELCILWVRDVPGTGSEAAAEPDQLGEEGARWRAALLDIAGSVPFNLEELLDKHGLSHAWSDE